MKALLAALIFACFVPGLASTAGLDTFAWKNRVLLVVAEAGNSMLAQQRQGIAAQQAALAERDMVVLQVSGDTVTPLYGNAPGVTAGELLNAAKIDPSTSGFQAVLIGKDGGVKLRQDRPITAEALFGLIDAMPMRAGEQRGAKSSRP